MNPTLKASFESLRAIAQDDGTPKTVQTPMNEALDKAERAADLPQLAWLSPWEILSYSEDFVERQVKHAFAGSFAASFHAQTPLRYSAIDVVHADYVSGLPGFEVRLHDARGDDWTRRKRKPGLLAHMLDTACEGHQYVLVGDRGIETTLPIVALEPLMVWLAQGHDEGGALLALCHLPRDEAKLEAALATLDPAHAPQYRKLLTRRGT